MFALFLPHSPTTRDAKMHFGIAPNIFEESLNEQLAKDNQYKKTNTASGRPVTVAIQPGKGHVTT